MAKKAGYKLSSMWTQVQGLRMHARVSLHPKDAAGAESNAVPDVPDVPSFPNVVLVHGLGVSSHYMVPTAELLAADCSVYAVDLPGFGKSEHPRHVYDVPQMADALDAWMEATGLESAHFLGNSMGCQYIIDLAVRYPDRVLSAALVGPTFDRTARASLPSLLLRVARDAPWEPRSLSPIIVYDYLSAGLIRVAITLRYGLLDPIEEKLPKVHARTLLIKGEHDSVVPVAWIRYMARLIPWARWAVVPGAPHAVNFSAPHKLAKLVLPFFRG